MKRIMIIGASGSGKSTLGAALAEALNVPHFDIDNFYWMPTDPPFTTPRPITERLSALTAALDLHENWVLEGSALKWGDELIPRYQLVVFLYAEQSIRIERLRLREQARYGERIATGGDMEKRSAAFIDWAREYDSAGLEQRSLSAHENWLRSIPVPVLRLDGAQATKQLTDIVLSAAARS